MMTLRANPSESDSRILGEAYEIAPSFEAGRELFAIKRGAQQVKFERIDARRGFNEDMPHVRQLRNVDCPEHTRHPRPSRRSLFKGLGTQAAKMTMATGSIVKDLDVVEDVGHAPYPGFYRYVCGFALSSGC